jgi:hypothetical protein
LTRPGVLSGSGIALSGTPENPASRQYQFYKIKYNRLSNFKSGLKFKNAELNGF